MDFYEGQVFVGIYPPDVAIWCNEGQQFHLEEIALGMWKIVANRPIIPDITPEMQEQIDHQELITALPDAVADLSQAVSDTAENSVDIMDAIAELSEIVSQLVEGA